jgi:cytidylate kinase
MKLRSSEPDDLLILKGTVTMNRTFTLERLTKTLDQAHQHWDARPKDPPSPPAFTIALSREAGANGSVVARAVAERLDWPVYDRELLERIGHEMGLRASLLESVDERQQSWLLECLESISSNSAVSESAYVRQLVKMLLSLAAHGECVIVGRGAAQVLPPATTLRVRLVGPAKDRIKSVQQKYGVASEEAALRVHKTDRERNRFVQDHFHKDPDDASLYDLVLNTTRFSVTECAQLTVDALRQLKTRVPARQRQLVAR